MIIAIVGGAYYFSYYKFPANCSSGYGLSLVRASFEEGPAGHQGYELLAIDHIREVGRGDHELKCVGNALVKTRPNNTNTVDIHYRYTVNDGQLSAQWSTEPWWE